MRDPNSRSNVWKDSSSPYGGYRTFFSIPEAVQHSGKSLPSYPKRMPVPWYETRRMPSHTWETAFDYPSDYDDADETVPDMIYIRHRTDFCMLQFPAFSLLEGILTIGDIRRAIAAVLEIDELRRIKILYRAQELRYDDVKAGALGIKQESTLTVVVKQLAPPGYLSSDEDEWFQQQEEREIAERAERKRRKAERKRKEELLRQIRQLETDLSNNEDERLRPRKSRGTSRQRRDKSASIRLFPFNGRDDDLSGNEGKRVAFDLARDKRRSRSKHGRFAHAKYRDGGDADSARPRRKRHSRKKPSDDTIDANVTYIPVPPRARSRSLRRKYSDESFDANLRSRRRQPSRVRYEDTESEDEKYTLESESESDSIPIRRRKDRGRAASQPKPKFSRDVPDTSSKSKHRKKSTKHPKTRDSPTSSKQKHKRQPSISSRSRFSRDSSTSSESRFTKEPSTPSSPEPPREPTPPPRPHRRKPPATPSMPSQPKTKPPSTPISPSSKSFSTASDSQTSTFSFESVPRAPKVPSNTPPLELIRILSNYADTTFVPACREYIRNPPRDPEVRERIATYLENLGDSIFSQLDTLVLAGQEEARLFRKTLTNKVQTTIELVETTRDHTK